LVPAARVRTKESVTEYRGEPPGLMERFSGVDMEVYGGLTWRRKKKLVITLGIILRGLSSLLIRRINARYENLRKKVG